MKHITFVTGDTLPAIYGTLKNDDGVVINITGYEIKLHIRLPELVLIKTAVIVDAAAGTFKFSIAADDLSAGTHEAEIEVTDGTGAIQTAQKNTAGRQFCIVVNEEIA